MDIGAILKAIAGSGSDDGGAEAIPTTIQSEPSTVDYAGEAPPGSSMQTTTIPNPDYKGLPYKDTLNWTQRLGGRTSSAPALNEAYLQQKLLQPGEIQTATTIHKQNSDVDAANFNKNQDFAIQRQKAVDDEKAAEQGQALFMAGSSGLDPNLQSSIQAAIPSPSVVPSQHDLGNLNRLYLAMHGNQATQGGSVSTIPSNAASAARNVNLQQEAAGESPYSSTIGGLRGLNTTLQESQNANINVNPDYLRASTLGKIAQAGAPAVTKVSPGEGIYNPVSGEQYTGTGTASHIEQVGGIKVSDPKSPYFGQSLGGRPEVLHTTIPGYRAPMPASKSEIDGIPAQAPTGTGTVIRNTPSPTTLSDKDVIQKLLGNNPSPQMLNQRPKTNTQAIMPRAGSLTEAQKARLKNQKDEEALRAGKTLKY
jgi:hypothetical protein